MKSLSKINKDALIKLFDKYGKYLWAILVLFFAIIFVNMLNDFNNDLNATPSVSQVNSYLTVNQATTTINPTIVNQLESLKNNSVSVKALFNQYRQNPFP